MYNKYIIHHCEVLSLALSVLLRSSPPVFLSSFLFLLHSFLLTVDLLGPLTQGWDCSFWREIGLGDLTEDGCAKIGKRKLDLVWGVNALHPIGSV